jgi:hypothetical protein
MTPPEAAAQNSLWTWLGFGAMCVAMFMAILDKSGDDEFIAAFHALGAAAR